MNPAENIQLLIPQRPPFVMIGQLLFSGENITRTAFRIPEENIFVSNGLFLEAGLLENMAQTAAAGAGKLAMQENKPVRTGYIVSVKNLEIIDLPKTGDEIITEVKTEGQVMNVTIISGSVRCNDILMARCGMKIFISDTA
jgi:predicted hotdog family 3-hydroxylacyl-ACP dehydratase